MHAQSAVWAWGTSMYLDIKFHQYVTYVLAGCLENYFLELQKIRILRTLKLLSMCHRSSLNCLLCQYSLSLLLFVHYPQGMCSDALNRPCRHCPGSLCCLNPFGTCLEFLLNFRADRSTTVCVLQQPYNQQSPCSATPLWKQRFDIGRTI